MPVFATAQTVSTQAQLTQQLIQLLTQMIAQLEQQIQQILAQKATTQPVPSVSENTTPTVITPTLPVLTPAPQTSSLSIDYSVYTPVSFELYSSNPGAYLGKTISMIGMVNSFLPKGGRGGNSNYIEIINPFDPSQPEMMLEIDDSATYTSAVASLQDKSSPILQFLQVYGTGVLSQSLSQTNAFISRNIWVPVISVTRTNKCLHGSMNTTILTGSSLSDNFQCTDWTTITQ